MEGGAGAGGGGREGGGRGGGGGGERFATLVGACLEKKGGVVERGLTETFCSK